VVQAGRFEKLLKMIFWRPSLALDVAFSSRYTLLAGVASSLITAAIAGYYGDAMGSPLLHFLTTLSAFPSALDGGLGGCSSATINGHIRAA
jgi:hypothetical protein